MGEGVAGVVLEEILAVGAGGTRRGGDAFKGVGDVHRAALAGGDEVDVCGGQAFGHGVPVGEDEGQVVGERFEDDQRVRFGGVAGGEEQHVGAGVEVVFGFGGGEADVVDGRAAAGGVSAEGFGGGGIVEVAGNGEAHAARATAVGFGDAGEGGQHAFGAGAGADKNSVQRALVRTVAALPVREGIGDAVADDDGAVRVQVGDVGAEGFAEHEREFGAAEGAAGESAFEGFGVVLQPVAEAGGVPVEDEAGGERAAEKEQEKIAVEGDALAGRGHVIEVHAAVAQGESPDAPDGDGEREQFAPAPATDVGVVAREREVDVVQLDLGGGGGERVEQRLHHETLAVDGGRNLREDEQLHRELGMWRGRRNTAAQREPRVVVKPVWNRAIAVGGGGAVRARRFGGVSGLG